MLIISGVHPGDSRRPSSASMAAVCCSPSSMYLSGVRSGASVPPAAPGPTIDPRTRTSNYPCPSPRRCVVSPAPPRLLGGEGRGLLVTVLRDRRPSAPGADLPRPIPRPLLGQRGGEGGHSTDRFIAHESIMQCVNVWRRQALGSRSRSPGLPVQAFPNPPPSLA